MLLKKIFIKSSLFCYKILKYLLRKQYPYLPGDVLVLNSGFHVCIVVVTSVDQTGAYAKVIKYLYPLERHVSVANKRRVDNFNMELKFYKETRWLSWYNTIYEIISVQKLTKADIPIEYLLEILYCIATIRLRDYFYEE